ncbi:MAG: possible Neuromedin U [Olavius algarvensis Delta 4 endosymbiont]|nr:MAG: possible Neuromedin U [Olavius algarvensis Delta 4 endosymbiont]
MIRLSPTGANRMRCKIIILVLVWLFSAGIAFAQDAGQAAPGKAAGGEDLAAKTQNPVGAMYSLPFKFTFDYGADNGEATFLNVQPVIPVTVGDWNLINRVIVPLVDLDGTVTGTPEIPNPTPGDGASGLGDINYSLFVSPAEPGNIIWGVGPSLMMDTATDEQLGSGKWSAGPTAVILVQPKPWTVGLLGRQLWDVAGDDTRRSVSQLLLEPFINYNLADGWYLLTDMIITANWQADSGNRWTMPLGGGLGKMFAIGNQKMNTKVEAYYNVEKPHGAPDWSLNWTLQFLFPR